MAPDNRHGTARSRAERPMKKIRKAVITAAGLGTRFLPVTKSQPKEMLPLFNKPLIQYSVEEAVSCGIELVAGVPIPKLLEISFLAKNRSEFLPYHGPIPTKHDVPNVAGKDEIILTAW